MNQTVIKTSNPLSQKRSIEAYVSNHTAKVRNKFSTRSNIIDELRAFASSVPDFSGINIGNLHHRLDDIISMMILGRLAGHIGRADIVEFGRHISTNFAK